MKLLPKFLYPNSSINNLSNYLRGYFARSIDNIKSINPKIWNDLGNITGYNTAVDSYSRGGKVLKSIITKVIESEGKPVVERVGKRVMEWQENQKALNAGQMETLRKMQDALRWSYNNGLYSGSITPSSISEIPATGVGEALEKYGADNMEELFDAYGKKLIGYENPTNKSIRYFVGVGGEGPDEILDLVSIPSRQSGPIVDFFKSRGMPIATYGKLVEKPRKQYTKRQTEQVIEEPAELKPLQSIQSLRRAPGTIEGFKGKDGVTKFYKANEEGVLEPIVSDYPRATWSYTRDRLTDKDARQLKAYEKLNNPNYGQDLRGRPRRGDTDADLFFKIESKLTPLEHRAYIKLGKRLADTQDPVLLHLLERQIKQMKRDMILKYLH